MRRASGRCTTLTGAVSGAADRVGSLHLWLPMEGVNFLFVLSSFTARHAQAMINGKFHR
jgi:hypothetical protein